MLKILSLLACLFFATTTSAQHMPQDKTYTFDDCVTTYDTEAIQKTQVGHQFWFADKDFTDGRTIKMSVVDPGKSTHAPHQHPQDEFFFVLEGTAQFYLDGKTVEVGPYTSLYCPSNSMHGISNAGDIPLKYLVMQKYEQ